jgi:hypothetical protein
MLSKPSSDLLHLFEKNTSNMCGDCNIDTEGLFLADALGLTVADDWTVIDAVGQTKKPISITSQQALKSFNRMIPQITDFMNSYAP